MRGLHADGFGTEYNIHVKREHLDTGQLGLVEKEWGGVHRTRGLSG
jgi:hypothetical protein